MSDYKVSAIIVAAGTGSRLGGNTPKQYLQLEGKEILEYSVDLFREHQGINDIIIVVGSLYMAEIAKEYPDCTVVTGGSTRQDSVERGLNACAWDVKGVLVHDAARPFLSRRILNECLAGLDAHDGAAPILPLSDSIVESTEEGYSKIDRGTILRVQTPQAFQLELLRTAHRSGRVATDEIGLVLSMKPDADILLFEGDPINFKITTDLDLKLARLIAQEKFPS